MLAIYNGKEYVCRDYSLTGDGWYTKMVYDYVETENPRYINERIIPVTKDEAEQYLKLEESEWKNSNRR